jgi:hypothetical protein
MVWLKRILLIFACLLTAVVVLCAVGIGLYRATPSWYRPVAVSPEEQADAAGRARVKLSAAVDWANKVQDQQGRLRNGQNLTQPLLGPQTIVITQDEINAFFDQWDDPVKNQLQDHISRFLTDGRIILLDGRIIVAGRARDSDVVISAHFEPKIENGKLIFQLNKILAGDLPVPRSFLAASESKLRRQVEGDLPGLSANATFDERGLANGSAMATAVCVGLLKTLDGQPADAMVFLPSDADLQDVHRGIPVRLTSIEVTDGLLTLTIAPMSDQERADELNTLQHAGD